MLEEARFLRYGSFVKKGVHYKEGERTKQCFKQVRIIAKRRDNS
jgi:hypothetical protein